MQVNPAPIHKNRRAGDALDRNFGANAADVARGANEAFRRPAASTLGIVW
jgi:hypothetical protein